MKHDTTTCTCPSCTIQRAFEKAERDRKAREAAPKTPQQSPGTGPFSEHLHCMDCSWEGPADECSVYETGKACPICGSDAIPYAEWLTEKAEDR